MFQFIKSLFKTKKAEEIQFRNMEEWFSQKCIDIELQYKARLDEIAVSLEEQYPNIKENIRKLEDAKLQNEKIPERAKHFMEGNREAYIKRTKQFMQLVKSMDMTETDEFSTSVKEEVLNFAKSTQKAYTVLQEFFSEESGNIARNIKKIETIAIRLKDEKVIIQYKRLKEIKKEVSSIPDIDRTQKEKIEQLKNEEEERKSVRNELKETVDLIEELKNSTEKRSLDELNEEIHEKKEALKIIEYNYTHNFTPIEAALKKYEKVTIDYQILINEYIKNPVLALTKDKEMDIVKIIEKLYSAIKSGFLELKEQKKKKTMLALEKMSEANFRKFLMQYNQINEEISSLQDKLEVIDILERIKKKEDHVEELKYKVSRKETSIVELEKKIDHLDTDKVRNKVREELQSLFDGDIKIID